MRVNEGVAVGAIVADAVAVAVDVADAVAVAVAEGVAVAVAVADAVAEGFAVLVNVGSAGVSVGVMVMSAVAAVAAESTGAEVADASGNRHPARVQGTPRWTGQGRLGGAFELDDAGNFVDCGDTYRRLTF